MRAAWMLPVLSLILVATPPRVANAGLIATAPLATVVAASSHIALVRFDRERGFTAETWFRGAWKEGALPIVELPSVLHAAVHGEQLRFKPFLSERAPVDEPLDRIVLLLEEHHGRLHPTGYRRRGPGFGAHSSVRTVTQDGRVFAYRQVINPGEPKPVPASKPDYETFASHLKHLIEKHPYTPPPHPVKLPPIPLEEREGLLALTDGRIDLYQGGWHVTHGGWYGSAPDRDGIEKLAKELESFAKRTKSKAAALHALDAMVLMSRKASSGWDHQRAVRSASLRAYRYVERAQARVWVLDEIDHGPYGADLVGLTRLAQGLGTETHERALGLLEGWVERTNANKGLGAYWALLALGRKRDADAAVARREAREAKTAKGK